MDLSRIDKNRLTVAIIATVALLSFVFMASGRSADDPNIKVVNTTTTSLNIGLSTDITADAPANVEGPVSADPNGQGQIAYPADNDGQMVRGIATFKRFPDAAKTGCATTLIPLGATITVRNLNNGHKTTCQNINIGPTTGTFEITLNTDVFADIAELIDAPLPVELTW
jgi:hypothetical protein